MKIEVTKPQLKAVLQLADDIDAMIGCGDNDEIWIKRLKLIDRMLKKNGINYPFMCVQKRED